MWAQEQKLWKSCEPDIGYKKDEYRNRSLFFEQKPVCKQWTDAVKNSFYWDLHEGYAALFVIDIPKSHTTPLLFFSYSPKYSPWT